jgi:hypothetical protein
MSANLVLPGQDLFDGETGSFSPSTSQLLEDALRTHRLDGYSPTRDLKCDFIARANPERLSDLAG